MGTGLSGLMFWMQMHNTECGMSGPQEAGRGLGYGDAKLGTLGHKQTEPVFSVECVKYNFQWCQGLTVH